MKICQLICGVVICTLVMLTCGPVVNAAKEGEHVIHVKQQEEQQPQAENKEGSDSNISGVSTIKLARGQQIIGVHFLPGVRFSVSAVNNGPGAAKINIRPGNHSMDINLPPGQGSSLANFINSTANNSVVDIVAPNKDAEVVVTLTMSTI